MNNRVSEPFDNAHVCLIEHSRCSLDLPGERQGDFHLHRVQVNANVMLSPQLDLVEQSFRNASKMRNAMPVRCKVRLRPGERAFVSSSRLARYLTEAISGLSVAYHDRLSLDQAALLEMRGSPSARIF
jgi:hypothetical protein